MEGVEKQRQRGTLPSPPHPLPPLLSSSPSRKRRGRGRRRRELKTAAAETVTAKVTPKGEEEGEKGGEAPVPLETPWTLTYWHGSDWQVPLVVAEDIATAGAFFGVHNAVPPLSAIIPGTYNLFRRGTRPVWEDAVHAGGGKWTRSFSVMPPAAGGSYVPGTIAAAVWKEAEAAWLHMQLWALGENGGDRVVGVSAAVRRAGVRLSIWVTAAEETAPHPSSVPDEAYAKEAYAREGKGMGSSSRSSLLIYASHEGSIQRGRAYEGGPPSLLLH